MKKEERPTPPTQASAAEAKFHNDYSYFEEPRYFSGVTLHQIGERYCRSGSFVGTHTHGDFFELTYAISGRARCMLNGVYFPVAAGDLYLSFPGETHALYSDKAEPFRYYYFSFSFPKDSPDRAFFEDRGLRTLAEDARVRHAPAYFSTVTELMSYPDRDTTYEREVMGLLLRLAALRLLPLYGQGKGSAYVSPTVDERRDLAYTVLRYIDTHLTDLREMREIADALGYSYAHLCRVFHEKMGVTISHYCAEKRLELAHDKLTEGEMSVTELATALGYSSIYAFSRAYKARYKESPRAARLAARSAAASAKKAAES